MITFSDLCSSPFVNDNDRKSMIIFSRMALEFLIRSKEIIRVQITIKDSNEFVPRNLKSFHYYDDTIQTYVIVLASDRRRDMGLRLVEELVYVSLNIDETFKVVPSKNAIFWKNSVYMSYSLWLKTKSDGSTSKMPWEALAERLIPSIVEKTNLKLIELQKTDPQLTSFLHECQTNLEYKPCL